MKLPAILATVFGVPRAVFQVLEAFKNYMQAIAGLLGCC